MRPLIFHFACGLVLLFGPFAVAALTVMECVDSAGNSSFRDKCPPEMSVKSTRELRGTASEEPHANDGPIEQLPVVLFGAPDCEACELVRDHLNGRSIPFTEKDATKDLTVQAELAAITGGPLTVPTLTIGDQKFTGFNRSALKAALTTAGYP